MSTAGTTPRAGAGYARSGNWARLLEYVLRMASDYLEPMPEGEG